MSWVHCGGGKEGSRPRPFGGTVESVREGVGWSGHGWPGTYTPRCKFFFGEF
jgi:hypothetical protein